MKRKNSLPPEGVGCFFVFVLGSANPSHKTLKVNSLSPSFFLPSAVLHALLEILLY